MDAINEVGYWGPLVDWMFLEGKVLEQCFGSIKSWFERIWLSHFFLDMVTKYNVDFIWSCITFIFTWITLEVY